MSGKKTGSSEIRGKRPSVAAQPVNPEPARRELNYSTPAPLQTYIKKNQHRVTALLALPPTRRAGRALPRAACSFSPACIAAHGRRQKQEPSGTASAEARRVPARSTCIAQCGACSAQRSERQVPSEVAACIAGSQRHGAFSPSKPPNPQSRPCGPSTPRTTCHQALSLTVSARRSRTTCVLLEPSPHA